MNSAADGNSLDEILKDALVGSWDWAKWDLGVGFVSGSGSKLFDASMGRFGGKDSIVDDVARGSDDIVDGVSSGGKGVGNGDGVVDDVVGGNGKLSKVPEIEYNAIRKSSVHNAEVDSVTLGKYNAEGKSYINEANKMKSSYFDLGNNWGVIQKNYNLSDPEMVEYFNKPFLQDAINNDKTIIFSHDPRKYTGFLADEWAYLQSQGYKYLLPEGDVWIARK